MFGKEDNKYLLDVVFSALSFLLAPFPAIALASLDVTGNIKLLWRWYITELHVSSLHNLGNNEMQSWLSFCVKIEGLYLHRIGSAISNFRKHEIFRCFKLKCK